MLQSKDTELEKKKVADWIIKTKNLQYAAYKRPTLGQRTHIDWNID